MGVLERRVEPTPTPAPPPCAVHPKPNDHGVFEVVFGRTQTLAAAKTLLVRVQDAGFRVGIEVDRCTEYEVAVAVAGNLTAQQVAALVLDA
ncbi:MAG TPA: hypothetical protein VIG35_01735 [Gaiellaceae bacterium]